MVTKIQVSGSCTKGGEGIFELRELIKMTTFITYKPHYCNIKYGEAVCDRIFYLRKFGLSRKVPAVSNILLGILNSFRLPKDSIYFSEGPAELYPFLRGKPKESRIIAFMKESTMYDFLTMSNRKKRFMLKLFAKADAFITDTQYYKNLTKKYIDKDVFVHPPFCAQPFFDTKPDINAKKLLFIAERDRKKGLAELLEAFKILRTNDSEWELFVIGRSGTLIKNKIEGVHTEGFVKSMEPYMQKCSIYVHPSAFDVFGVSVLEAMSAGVIPIVSTGAGASEYVKKEFKNLVIQDNSPITIADKIEEVYNYDRQKKLRISRRCKNFVKKDYTEDKNVRQFKKIFGGIVSA